MNPTPENRSTGWFVLSLCALTVFLVYTIPTLMLPVLFAEIAADLDLDILQLGIAWGSISLSSIFVGLFGGALGDRYGSKATLGTICLLTGVLGALRGIAPNYLLLIITFMVYSLVAPAIPPNLHKAGAHFFPNNKGVSTVVISLAFAFSLFVGARYTATFLSPLLGGWRNVLYLFGGTGILFSAVWFLLPNDLLPQPANRDKPFFSAVFTALRHVLGVRELWIIGLGSTLFWGCFRGFSGYTPLYLRGLGWTAEMADQTLSNFFLASLILAVPATYLSERWGNRKLFMILSMVTSGIGIMLIGAINEDLIPIAIVIGGLMFDAFMSIHQAEVLDLDGIYPYAGSALGALVMFREVGGVLSPPIGSWLAQFNPDIPFFFWGALGLTAGLIFAFLRPQTPKS